MRQANALRQARALRHGLAATVAAAVLTLPVMAQALGGKASAPASGSLLAHTVMVLGSRGSACSGTLIAPDVVLTAGHCVEGSREIAIAWIDRGKPVLEPVTAAATHPQFSGFNQRSIDLALLRLSKPMRSDFQPARLDDALEHDAYELAGFGLQTSYDEASAGRLRSVETGALALSTSRVLHLGRESSPSDIQICKGDSGGPVFAATPGGAVLSAVIVATYNSNVKPGARWSAICGNTAQAIRIAPQRGWIDGVVAGWR